MVVSSNYPRSGCTDGECVLATASAIVLLTLLGGVSVELLAQ